MKKPNIILGTAQFGSKYGITNKNGQISSKKAEEIFNFCNKNNIDYLDSAQSYGNSEKIIGEALASHLIILNSGSQMSLD